MEKGREDMRFSLVLDENTFPVVKQVSEGMPGGFFMYHATGAEELIYANSAMYRIFGCETEDEFKELTGYTFPGIVHPDDVDRVEKSIARQIEDSIYDLDYVEYRIIQKDGSVRWVQDYGHFLSTEDFGDIFYVFIEDATERLKTRMAELEDMNKELRYAYAMERQYKKAILYDASFFFEINLTRDEFITSVKQEVKGKKRDWFELMRVPVFSRYSQFVNYRAASQGQATQEDYRRFFDRERLIGCYSRGELEQTLNLWGANYLGKKCLFHYIILLGKNEFTDDIVALFIARDITEQTRKQNLLQSALRQAESANLARSTFLTNMSHDIRTPLNAIIGYTDLIKNNTCDSRKINDYVSKIRLSGQQLLSILDEALEVTRIESGKVDLTEKECSLHDLFRELEDIILPEAVLKDIWFDIDQSEVRHFAVIADLLRIREVLYQLLDNAIKYTNSGGSVSLVVKETKVDFSGYGKYEFIVKDNGIGISEEFKGKLFEPFKRENNTTESGVSGTGLGLTVVKSLVDMMGGDISVESTLGKGSQFAVSLLLRRQKKIKPSSREPENVVDNASLQGKRILLAEDNAINCEIAQKLLMAQGYLVETAENGQIALDMVKNSKPGYYMLILMDIQMPVMDGHEATRRIRQLEEPELANIPIIALSANAFAEDYYRSIESGMDAHFSKPIDMESLQELIRSVIGKRKNKKKS